MTEQEAKWNLINFFDKWLSGERDRITARDAEVVLVSKNVLIDGMRVEGAATVAAEKQEVDNASNS